MNHVISLGLSAMAFVMLATDAAYAVPLPETAVPMTREEVVQIHVGRTLQAPDSDTFVAEDGTTKGIYGKPKIIDTFTGKWTVVDNEFCMENQPGSSSAPTKDCTKFWKDGRRFFVLWSVRSDGKAVDAVNGYQPFLPKRRTGDVVSGRYKAAGGK
jgi:hypothetical protein